ncbi:MAG: transporter permease [Flaviaesturariibacter sp.]|nr:transporter permease [Flaviaesturariibacter sp.]
MKSTKNTRAVVVGIFVVLGLLIFIGGVLTLGGQRKSFGSSVALKAVFHDVNGLQAGNNIWLSGVKVGTVKELAFIGAGQVEVRMNLDSKMQPYVHKDTKAKVGTDGLIGNKIIVLYGGTAATPVVGDGDLLAVESAVGMDEMMATLQSNNKNLLAITTDFKEVSQRLAAGQGTIGKLLKDESLSNSLSAALATLQRAAGNATVMTQNLSAYTAKLQQKGNLANDLVTDTVVFSRLRSSMSQIETLTQTANGVINNLQQTASGINSSLADKNSPAGALLHDEQTAASLKATVKNLETSTQKLDENMEALQHNFLLRGFFRKKAKAETKQ